MLPHDQPVSGPSKSAPPPGLTGYLEEVSLLRRQLLNSVLTANALWPPRSQRAGSFAFFPGWLVSELAPQLMGATALDAVLHVRGRKHRALGLTLAAANLVGQAVLIRRGQGSRAVTENALRTGIGEDYITHLGQPPTEAELATPWRNLIQPFVFSTPVVKAERNIAYGDAPRRRNLLDIYRRADGPPLDKAPVLLQVHGGGWITGEKEQQGRALMNRMAEQGWVCVAINYRLSPRDSWPAHIVDVKKAIAWVKEHIAEYGGDPDYVVVTGGSAGGHLSALAALTPNDPQFQPGFEDADTTVAAAVPFYGVFDLSGASGLKSAVGTRDGFLNTRVFKVEYADDPDIYEQASPLCRITPDAPDFFVVHGANDSLVDVNQARVFVTKLRELSKNNLTYLELPGAQHGFEIFPSVRSEHVIRGVQRWLTWHHNTHR